MECEKIMELFHSELVTVNVTMEKVLRLRKVSVKKILAARRRRRQRNAGNFGVAWRAGLK